jgi:hypothetical protein
MQTVYVKCKWIKRNFLPFVIHCTRNKHTGTENFVPIFLKNTLQGQNIRNVPHTKQPSTTLRW